MNDKKQMLQTLEEEFNRWEELLASLSEAQITAPQPRDNWSIKDVIAHLRAWQQRSIARLEAARLNRKPEFPMWPAGLDAGLDMESEEDTTHINALLYETYREQPWTSVHRDWQAGFRRFLELGEAMPEPDLLEPGRYAWLGGPPLAVVLHGSYEHHDEHFGHVLAGLWQHGKMKIAREMMSIKEKLFAKAEMLIRKPVADVFEAFVDPAITSRFWFTKSSGRLETGKQIQWDWEMYDFSVQVSVKAIEQNKRISIEWTGYGAPTTVEWTFTPRADNTTFVSVTNTGFSGDGDEIVKQAISSTEGFTLVLSGLKALLEHNIILNLVSDRFPEGLEKR